ncbi:MAG: PRC-barrel domain containing protein [Mycetocola sp.]
MLLSDLLGKPVHAVDGSSLGAIVDVRFRRAPRTGRHEGALELIALVVSPHSRHSMYGYERGRVNGPLVIAALIRWLHRKSRVIPWDCVSRVDPAAVVLGVEPPVIPLDVRSPIPVTRL